MIFLAIIKRAGTEAMAIHLKYMNYDKLRSLVSFKLFYAFSCTPSFLLIQWKHNIVLSSRLYSGITKNATVPTIPMTFRKRVITVLPIPKKPCTTDSELGEMWYTTIQMTFGSKQMAVEIVTVTMYLVTTVICLSAESTLGPSAVVRTDIRWSSARTRADSVLVTRKNDMVKIIGATLLVWSKVGPISWVKQICSLFGMYSPIPLLPK